MIGLRPNKMRGTYVGTSVASTRTSKLVARVTLALGVLAAAVVLLALLAWQAYKQVAETHAQRVRSEVVLSALHALESATQPQAQVALCALTGGPALSPRDTVPSLWPDAANHLGKWITDEPTDLETVNAFNTLRRDLDQWEQSYAVPLRNACAQGQRLGVADVQSRVRVSSAQRARIEESFKHVRNLSLERRRTNELAWRDASQASRLWLWLLSIVSVLMGLSALLVARSFVLRLADVQRNLFDEVHEREIAREQLALSQRRMRVLVDHVKDAVIAFDAQGRIQWVNPSGEVMFGAQRNALLGVPVTLLMPELDAEIKASASPDRATITDEHGLPWVSKQLTLQGHRMHSASGTVEKITLDVSFVQTHAEGHAVGVCVARDLSGLRRMQREHDAVLSTLRHKVVPQAKALQTTLEQAQSVAHALRAVSSEVLAPLDEAAPMAKNLSTMLDEVLHRPTQGQPER